MRESVATAVCIVFDESAMQPPAVYGRRVPATFRTGLVGESLRGQILLTHLPPRGKSVLEASAAGSKHHAGVGGGVLPALLSWWVLDKTGINLTNNVIRMGNNTMVITL